MLELNVAIEAYFVFDCSEETGLFFRRFITGVEDSKHLVSVSSCFSSALFSDPLS
jgi:hypothetical protein